MAKHKPQYRFADLGVGDEFYIDTYPYDKLTVASTFSGAWLRNQERVILHPNTRVDPVNKRKAAASRRSMIAQVCRKHGIKRDELVNAYRDAIFHVRWFESEERRTNAAKMIPEGGVRDALKEIDLIRTIFEDGISRGEVICGDRGYL